MFLLLMLHEVETNCETFLTVMAIDLRLGLFTFVVIKSMLVSSMFYQIVFGSKYCVTAVASVLSAVHVHHVVDMCVFVISYEVTVVTFD